MRILSFILGAAMLIASPVLGEQVIVDTKVTAVELHPDGMRAIRSFDLDLPAGKHRVEFRDFIPDSIETLPTMQVNFGDADVSIGGLGFTRYGLKPVARTQTPKEKTAHDAYRAALKDFNDLKLKEQLYQAEITSAKAQIAYLKSFNSKKPSQSESTQNPPNISDNAQAIGREYLAALQVVLQAEGQIADLQEELAQADTYQEIAHRYWLSQRSPDKNQFSIHFDVTLAQPFKGTAELSTLSDYGNWSANYELHLTQNGAIGSAILQRRASIVNETSETWRDVKVSLLTSEINILTAVRDPYKNLAQIDPKPKPKLRSDSDKGNYGSLAEPVMEAEIMESFASSSGFTTGGPPKIKGQVIEFNLQDPLNLSPESGALVWLDQLKLDVDLSAKIVPSRYEGAFLIARLKNASNGPILNGNVYIFRDGVYIGEGNIPSVGIGEEFEISFGEYDGIEVQRDLIEQFDSDIGIISSTNRRVLRYRTTITSHLDFDIPVRLLGQVPVTQQEDLKITMIAKPTPTEKDVRGVLGVLAWQFTLPRDGSKQFELGYEAQWPPDMNFTTFR